MLLQAAGESQKLNKCKSNFSVDYPGHVIRPGKLQVATNAVKALDQAKSPHRQAELIFFLVFCKDQALCADIPADSSPTYKEAH